MSWKEAARLFVDVEGEGFREEGFLEVEGPSADR